MTMKTDIVSTLRAMNLDGVNHVGYAADVIESLQTQLANAEKRAASNYKDAMECTTLLAASQAREGVLRDFIFDYTEIEPNNEAMIARYDTCVKPTDDTSLKAALAAERERCAKIAQMYSSDAAYQIRALGDSDAN